MASTSKTELASRLEAEPQITVSQPQEALTATPFGTLFLVPPEVRVKIYRDLIALGAVRLFETSKAVYNEAIDILHQEGVCKLEFNGCKLSKIFPSGDSAKTILNLEIRLDLTNKFLTPPQPNSTCNCITTFNSWLTAFIGCTVTFRGRQPPIHPTPRHCCKILLDYNPGFSGTHLKNTFDLMKHLTGFKTLVLAITNDYPPYTTRRLMERMYDPRPSPQRDMESAMHSKANKDTLNAYRTARKALAPTLGPAEWVSNKKGSHLEFHPRAHNGGDGDGSQP
ncbi:MAG: hypothetical protein Q9175_006649 [Cornicularia normoerica]